MKAVVDIAGIVCSAIAALLWFMSAAGDLPPLVAYWDHAPDNDPFYSSIKRSARLNRWAALASGLAAGCMALSGALAAN